jgi:hypothetical protein
MSSPNAVFGSSPYALGGEPPTGGKLKPRHLQICALATLAIILLVIVVSLSSDTTSANGTDESTVLSKSGGYVCILVGIAAVFIGVGLWLDYPTKNPLGDNTTA